MSGRDGGGELGAEGERCQSRCQVLDECEEGTPVLRLLLLLLLLLRVLVLLLLLVLEREGRVLVCESTCGERVLEFSWLGLGSLVPRGAPQEQEEEE